MWEKIPQSDDGLIMGFSVMWYGYMAVIFYLFLDHLGWYRSILKPQ
jgi:hypothetical protein